MGKIRLYATLGLFLLISFLLNILILPVAKQCLLKGHFYNSLSLTSGALYANCASGITGVWPAITVLAVAIIALVLVNPVKVLVESSKKTTAALAIAVAVTAGFLLAYFAPGRMMLFDGVVFQAASFSYYQTFADGHLPFFFFPWALGSMHEVYHGQVFFALTGLANLLIRNIDIAFRVIAFLLHVLSGVAAFYLIRYMLKSNQAALIGSVIYSIVPEHVTKMLMAGRVIAGPVYLLLPVAMLLVELFLDSKLGKLKLGLGLSIISALMFLSSPQDAQVIVILLLGYFAVKMLAKEFSLKQVMHTVAIGVFVVAVFALLTSYWTVPYILESKYVNNLEQKAVSEYVPKLPSVSSALIPFVPVAAAISLLKMNITSGLDYLGLSAILLVLFALWKGDKRVRLLGIYGAIAVILGMVISSRTGPFVVMTMSILAAAGTIKLLTYLRIRKPTSSAWAYGVIFVVVAADLGMWSFFQVMPDLSMQEKVYNQNIPLMAGNTRVLDLQSNRRTYYPALVYMDRQVQVPFSILTVGDPKAFYYTATVVSRAAQETYDFNQTLSNEVREGFYMYNIGYVITHPDQVGISPAQSFSDKNEPLGLERKLPEVMKTAATPIIVSGEMKKIPKISEAADKGLFYSKNDFEQRTFPWENVSSVITRMGINSTGNSAAMIPLSDDADNAGAAADETVPVQPEVTVLQHEVKTAQVKILVNSTKDGYAQLSYAYYPWMDVQVDGRETKAFKSAFNLLVIRLPAGEHTITITPRLTPLRKVTFLVSMLTAAIAAFLLVHQRIFKPGEDRFPK